MISRRRFVQASAAAGVLAGAGVSWAIPPRPEAALGQLDPDIFAEALRAMRAIVGEQWVFSEEPQLLGYHDHFALKPIEAHAASGAVAPANVEQIQALLKVAREHSIPVWTISTGRNLGYGGSAPAMPGTLMLDLARMNRIIEVNEKHGYAVVEPGVSYKALYEHLQRIGSKLWIDCAAPGWGGVLGNMLDRGVGYTPMGEHFLQQQCGMQVVLSDGSVIDTGLGGQKGRLAEYTYRYGHGPWLDGLFTQSNFGVVTRLGVQLMPEPPGYRPYMVTFRDENAIEPLIEAVRPLKVAQLIPNAAVSTELIWEAAVEVRRDQYYDGDGPIPPSARTRLMDDLGIGEWNFYGALYGPEEVMDANWDVVRDALSQVPGAQFHTAEEKQGSAAFDYRARLMRGEPNMTEFGTVAWIPNAAHVGFAPIVPIDGKLALEQYRKVRRMSNEAGFDYFGEYIIGWRDMHHIYMPSFTRGNEEEGQRMLDLVNALIDDATQDRFGIYRTHLDFMDKVAASYDWNDNALPRFNSDLKAAFDPAGILAPGKSGIWPEGAQ